MRRAGKSGQPSSRGQPSHRPRRIVGVGASAGGLDALKRLFSALPAEAGLAIVILQHLPLTDGGGLRELVAGFTTMPVVRASNRMILAADHVYVAPAGTVVRVARGALQVRSSATHDDYRVDRLLTSIARSEGRRGVAIILSGAGDDGAAGICAVRNAGGLCLVQDPGSAGFDGMPRSALDTGAAHAVGAPEVIARALLPAPGKREPARVRREAPLVAILELLRARTGHEFACYKSHTLRRRLARRMLAVGAADLAAYAALLVDRPGEVDLLVADLLIGVTSFFRDPQAWSALRRSGLKRVVHAGGGKAGVRIWVPGCSTGQEAYSLAMLIDDWMARAGTRTDFRILATDMNPRALQVARRATYPEESTGDLPPGFADRYLEKVAGGVRVRASIRKLIAFAHHDLARDPPYSQLDLICCRNVLIYFEPELQRRLIPLFHFALRSGGVLFLGPSESLRSPPELFTTLDRAARLYVRKPGGRRAALLLPGQTASVTRWPGSGGRGGPDPSARQALAMRLLLKSGGRASVMVDEAGQVLYAAGDLAPFLASRPGGASTGLAGLLQPRLRRATAAALKRAGPGQETIRTEPVPLGRGPGAPSISVLVRTLRAPAALRGWTLVSFEDSAADAHVSGSPGQRLGELRAVREELSLANRELRTGAELRDILEEEAQSSSEELQSSNEELQTTKEELLTVNETVAVLNAELTAKVQELSLFNHGLSQLLANTRIATIFVDPAGRIERFTPAVAEVVPLVAADRGRPLTDVASVATLDGVAADCKLARRDARPVAREVQARDGRWYSRRVLPGAGRARTASGLVLTFSEITPQKHAQERLRALVGMQSVRAGAALIANVGGLIEHLDEELARRLARSAGSLIGTPLVRLKFPGYPGSWHRAFRAAIQHARDWASEVQVTRAHGDVRREATRVIALRDSSGGRLGTLLTVEDVGEKRMAANATAATERIAATLAVWGASVLSASGPEEALSAAARILVRQGGYDASWVCRVDPRSHRVVGPVASAGGWRGCAPMHAPPAAGAIPWRSPAGRALAEHAPAACDLPAPAGGVPGRLAVVPIRDGNKTIGLLGLRCNQGGALLVPELKLLENLADSLQFVLSQTITER